MKNTSRSSMSNLVPVDWRRQALLLLILLSLFLVVGGTDTANAAEFAQGEVYRLKAGETINDDLYVFGREIIIDGTVDGDLVAFGGVIEINGVVTGDLIAAGAGIVLNGEVLDDVRAAGSGITIVGSVGDDLLVAGGGGIPGMPISIGNRSVPSGINLLQGATVGGDMLVGGDRGFIAGDIAQNLVAGMNELEFDGRVGGDARLYANTLNISSGAEVGGTLTYSSASEPDLPDDVAANIVVQPWQTEEAVEETSADRGRDMVLRLAWWLLRTVLIAAGLALAGWLLLSFAPALIVKPVTTLDAKPAESVIFGFLALAISFPIVAALVFIGSIFWGWFPGGVAMFALSSGLLMTLWLLSPLVTGLWLGRRVLAGVDREVGTLPAMLTGALGIVVIARIFALVPCAGVIAYQLIYLLSFAFATGSGLLTLTSFAKKAKSDTELLEATATVPSEAETPVAETPLIEAGISGEAESKRTLDDA